MTPTELLCHQIECLKRDATAAIELAVREAVAAERDRWRGLLAKYVRHVGAAEGDAFARSVSLASCGMGRHEYTPAEAGDILTLFRELDAEDRGKIPT